MSPDYYYLDPDGQTVRGPFNRAEMRGLHRSGVISSEMRVCRAGTEDWQPLDSFSELLPDPPPRPVPVSPASPKRAQTSPAANGCLLGCGGLFLLLILSSLASKCSPNSYSPVPDSASSTPGTTLDSSANDARESETRAGFQEGRRIGNRRYREGFPRPTLAYLDQILAAAASNTSDAYRVGFKGGYLSAWDNHGSDL